MFELTAKTLKISAISNQALLKCIPFSFELSTEDPNYHADAEGAPEDMLNSGQIKYYVVQAEKLKQDEKVTMFIDFSHLLNYRFDETNNFSFVT